MVALLGERQPVGTTACGGSGVPKGHGSAPCRHVLPPRHTGTLGSRLIPQRTHQPRSVQVGRQERHDTTCACHGRTCRESPQPCQPTPTSTPRQDTAGGLVPARALPPTGDGPVHDRRSRRGPSVCTAFDAVLAESPVSPSNPARCPLGSAVASLQVAMQLQPHGDTPGQERPGRARHPSC